MYYVWQNKYEIASPVTQFDTRLRLIPFLNCQISHQNYIFENINFLFFFFFFFIVYDKKTMV